MAKEKGTEMEHKGQQGGRGHGRGQEMQRTTPMRALSPLDEMDRMMDRMFEGFFPRGWMRPMWPALGEMRTMEARIPKVDVIDRDDQIVVRAEVPGVDKEHLDVSLTDDTVTIKGSTQHEEEEEKGDYYRCEISRGIFSRTIALPAGVNTEQCKAQFKDGILELTLPKAEKAKRRSIKVE